MEKSKLTLPIVIGQKYVRRDGVVVDALEPHQYMGVDCCAYVGWESEAVASGSEHVWRDTGRIYRTEGRAHPFDLVADYVEAPAVPDGFTHWHGDVQPAADPAPAPAPAPAEAPSGQREHSHAEVLRWIADGHVPQWQVSAGQWVGQTVGMALRKIASGDYPASRFRLEPPPMLTVNGRKVQGGEVNTPAENADFYLPAPGAPDWVTRHGWYASPGYMEILRRGLVYLDRDACVARSKAMAGVAA